MRKESWKEGRFQEERVGWNEKEINERSQVRKKEICNEKTQMKMTDRVGQMGKNVRTLKFKK